MLRAIAWIGMIAVVALIAGALPLYAQQAGITLEGLAARVEMLVAGQDYVISRISALETAVAISSQQRTVAIAPTFTPTLPLPSPTPSFTPAPTSTPEPTKTATIEPSATPTPVPAEAKAVLLRRQPLRRGPGTSHRIVKMADEGEEFLILGRSLNGDWWQVSHEDSPVWISALYADAFDADNIRVAATPTPLPSPTLRPTRTPVPTATPSAISPEDWEFLMELVKLDLIGSGQSLDLFTDEQMHNWAGKLATKIRAAMARCGLSMNEIAAIANENAEIIDDAGISEKKGVSSRWDLISAVTEYMPEDDSRSCKEYMEERRRWILHMYGDD